jgi:hypothetical protein
MGLFQNIADMLPGIAEPAKPPSFSTKLKWAAAGLLVYIALVAILSYAISQIDILSSTPYYVFSTFMHISGYMILPIFAVSIITILAAGLKGLKTNFSDHKESSKFNNRFRLAAIIVALLLTFTIFARTPIFGYHPYIALGFLLSSIIIVYLNEALQKYSFAPGINLFMIARFSILFVILGFYQSAGIGGCLGTYTSISCIAEQYIPLVSALLILAASYFLVKQFRKANDSVTRLSHAIRAPMPFYVLSVPFTGLFLASYVASIVTTVLDLIYAAASSGATNLANFIAIYTPGTTGSFLIGGLKFLINAYFPLTYSASFGGIGNFSTYMTYLATHLSTLYLPWGGMVLVPEFIHVIIYSLFMLVIIMGTTLLWLRLSKRHINKESAQYRSDIIKQSLVIWALSVLEIAIFVNLVPAIDLGIVLFFVLETIRKSKENKL